MALAWLLEPLVLPTHDALYHWSGRPRDLFLPAILDFCCGWMLLFGVLVLAERRRRWRAVVWTGIALLLPAAALKGWGLYSATTPLHTLNRVLWLGGLALWPAVVLLWWRKERPFLEHAQHFVSVLLRFLAIPGLLLLCQSIWFGWKASEVREAIGWNRAVSFAAKPVRPRVVWLLFDELSSAQVYGDRLPGLRLPAFDALAKQATSFTDVEPAGMFTERVVPELMTGKRVDTVQPTASGALLLHAAGKAGWSAFDERNTVFEDAQKMGDRTAAVGWYNPYCRLLPDVLDSCFWTLNAPLQNGMEADAGLWSNMLRPLSVVAGEGWLQRVLAATLKLPNAHTLEYRARLADLDDLNAAADRVLVDPSLSFIFLHLPVPHPPGIYDRRRGAVTDGPSSYVANLALADRYLAHVRLVLERAGLWDASTLVVMGDHSWRTPIWRPKGDWSREDERASHGGRFDARPFYAVRLPEQQRSEEISRPFPALATRKLLDCLLEQQLHTDDDLRKWVNGRPCEAGEPPGGRH